MITVLNSRCDDIYISPKKEKKESDFAKMFLPLIDTKVSTKLLVKYFPSAF